MNHNSKRVLITGGAGGLGKIVSRAFCDEGYKVRVFDLDNKRTRKNIKDIERPIEVIWGDVTSFTSIENALEGVDVVIHMAAILPPWAYINPEKTFKVNLGGTQNVVQAIKLSGKYIPLIYTSSAAAFGPTPEATEPLCADRTQCKPKGAYGESKYKAELFIKSSNIDYVILRLTATMYLTFEFSDFPRMFTVPLNNRVEYCHPYDTAQAIINAVKKFDEIKGNTFIIAGGPSQRMYYRDMVKKMLEVYGLPMPPEELFEKRPYYLDWYDTAKSQVLLHFQSRTFQDFLRDMTVQIKKRYTSLFIPFMRYFIGPIFGKIIVRLLKPRPIQIRPLIQTRSFNNA